MILHFPCMARQNVSIPGQHRLSDYCQGLTFADMVQIQVDKHDHAIMATNADIPWVDESYPMIRDRVSA